MLKRIYAAFCILLFSTSLQTYSQNVCQNTKADSKSGQVEKYVYKQYEDDDGDSHQLRIALVRPVDNLPDKKRPLIIGVHSGGFLKLCLFEPCYVRYSENVLTQNFTPQGFATASIEYRLTSPLDFNLPNVSDDAIKESHYRAVQDVRDAIKYIFDNADKLGIDTNNVFLVGTSAGAITVLHAAYLDNDEVSKELTAKFGQLAEREKIKGVISLAGAIYDLKYLDGGDKIPLMLVHGNEDLIVPPEKGYYLQMSHLTPVYGDKAIYEEAQKKGIPAKGYFYDYGHSYTDKYKAVIFKNANEFIRSYLDCGSREKSITAAVK